MSDRESSAVSPASGAVDHPGPLEELRRALDEDGPDRPQLKYRTGVTLRMLYGLGDEPPTTFNEVGIVFGVSRQRVQQIERAGLKALGLEHLRPPAEPGRRGSAEPEPGYQRLARAADVPEGQGHDIRAWFRGAWWPAHLRKRYDLVCDMAVDMGAQEPVNTRLPVACIAIPEAAGPRSCSPAVLCPPAAIEAPRRS